jgi:hypothetical protein
MSKTVCKKKKNKELDKPKVKCKKCGGLAEKKKEVCKPAKI